MKKKWNLYNISEYRGVLIGIATLMIAFFHCYSYKFENIFSNNFIVSILHFIRKTNNVGVDIFLFLSAVGLYFSFSSNSDIKSFYKKRIIRIIPSFLIVAILYYLLMGYNFFELIKRVSLLSFYLDGIRDFWYFALIIILYLLYPLLHNIVDKKGIIGLILLLLSSIILTVGIMYIFPLYYKKVEIALTRVPVFLIGIFVGKKVKNKESINILYMLLFLVIFIISNYLLYNYKFDPYIYVRYIYCGLGISIVFLISYICSLIKIDLISKFLIFIGTYSMEVYLMFEKLSLEVRKAVQVNNNFIFYLGMFIITMILSFLLKKICDFIINYKSKKVKVTIC